ncbi:hypothetical protein HRG_007041 [Hirsutella rhossiliensis]|uniref:Uncharacterized protein n=1 Tax=Hirsutella rhossiliensis TaxID=111463 RepID=A0A9P8MXA2_9HYPO|nr:uncharacterized protein HRG_07041 [Hirsutella rhossiliensis]KAH0961961.1 hypothetical protein HRG_07041 [Hirsutella rhossiliensis]
MRTIHAGLAILSSGLAAVAFAEALPPEDIPVQCARMCGPMVELTSQCTPRRATRRSNLDEDSVADGKDVEPGVPERQDRRRGAVEGEYVDAGGDLEKRKFLVIVAVPKKPGPGQPTTITTTTPQSPADEGGQRGVAANSMPVGAEEKCVCLNKSFNVSEVAALCASCIMRSGDDMNNLNVIMSTCNFTSLQYVDGNENIVENIRVSATRPTVVGSQNGVVSRAPQTASLGASSALYLVMAAAILI